VIDTRLKTKGQNLKTKDERPKLEDERKKSRIKNPPRPADF